MISWKKISQTLMTMLIRLSGLLMQRKEGMPSLNLEVVQKFPYYYKFIKQTVLALPVTVVGS
jgi:hypothetical protein